MRTSAATSPAATARASTEKDAIAASAASAPQVRLEPSGTRLLRERAGTRRYGRRRYLRDWVGNDLR